MNDQTTQLLLVGAVIFIALQVQKSVKERDAELRHSGGGGAGGARTRLGRMADDASRLQEDAQSFYCDNKPDWMPDFGCA